VTRKRRFWIIGTLAAVLALAALVAAWSFHRRPHGIDEIPAALVPANWPQLRLTKGHEEHVGKQGIACKDCHDYEKEGFKDPGIAPCARCHEKETALTHPSNVAVPMNCRTCHVFAPDKVAPACISCHVSAQGVAAGMGEGHVIAITTHATTDCAVCHSPHRSPSGVNAACTSCHEERAPSHAAHAGSAGCADCHAPHTPAAAAKVICASCHAKPAGPRPAGHDSCLTCHTPHAFTASLNVCVDCHGAKPTLMAAAVPAHAVCTSCHAPHDPGAAASSCTGCHASVEVKHGAKTACVTCHEAHGTHTTVIASTCTSCHAKVATSDTGAHAGGIACTSCHKTHDFDPPGSKRDKLALCASCHAPEAALTARNPGHADCASCHGPSAHNPIAAPTCGSCHAVERATAPPGHQECVKCHQPHSGEHLASATCASCHEDKTKGPHANVQGGCATCHRPHGPKGPATPPACSTCHVFGKLPALHTAPGHQVCAGCHSAHGPPPAPTARPARSPATQIGRSINRRRISARAATSFAAEVRRIRPRR
jgi:hypothetical protein